ncbi:hypothetical protein HZB02_02035 [Candidatus Woesearchaeota archaeon]|nr:hypothetical protein [Candidatus Woesearchaeota archaeon]
MNKLRFLPTKEVKKINHELQERYGTCFDDHLAYMLLRETDLYLVTKDLARLDLSKLRLNTAGLYVGELMHEGFRPSIEGSQLLGKHATQGILDLDDAKIRQWVKGEEITMEKEDTPLVLIRHGHDFYGAGKIKAKKLLNFYPKHRRLSVVSS